MSQKLPEKSLRLLKVFFNQVLLEDFIQLKSGEYSLERQFALQACLEKIRIFIGSRRFSKLTLASVDDDDIIDLAITLVNTDSNNDPTYLLTLSRDYSTFKAEKIEKLGSETLKFLVS